jgi:hypothetical protein
MFEMEIEIIQMQIDDLTETILISNHTGLIAGCLILRGEKRKYLVEFKSKEIEHLNYL